MVTSFPYLGEDVAGTLELGYDEPPPTPAETIRWALWTNETTCADISYSVYSVYSNKAATVKSTTDGDAYSNDWNNRFVVDADPVSTKDVGIFNYEWISVLCKTVSPADVARLEVMVAEKDAWRSDRIGYVALDAKNRPTGPTNALVRVGQTGKLVNESSSIPVFSYAADLSDAGPVSNVMIVFHRDLSDPKVTDQTLSRIRFRLKEKETSLSFPTPLKAKAALDALMTNAGAEYLTSTAVKSVEADERGRISAVVVANRSGERRIAAGEVVDATRHGTLSALRAGGFPVGKTERFSRVVIATNGNDADNLATLRGRGLEVEKVSDFAFRGTTQVHVYRCTADLPMADGSFASFAAAEWTMRGLTVLPLMRDGADVLVWHRDPEHAADPVVARDAEEFDVVVVGGGTSGAPAGIGAGRAGARTLVVEYGALLGGVGTDGMLSGFYDGNRVGFTAELNATNGTHGVKNAPYIRAESWRRLSNSAGVTVWLNAMGVGAIRSGDRVTGVVVGTEFGPVTVRAKAFVDATGNSDLAAAAGAETVFIAPREIALQSAGLSPHRIDGGGCNSDFGYLNDGNARDLWLFLRRARAGAPRAPWDVSKMPNSRERRRIVPDLTLSAPDVAARRPFPDTVVQPLSRQDVHGFLTDEYVFIAEDCGTINPSVSETSPQFSVNVPMRALLPKGLSGIAVVGLGQGTDRDVLPITRMQADLMNMGYSMGTAAAMAAANGGEYRTIDVDALKRTLVGRGILRPEVLDWTVDTDETSDARIATAVRTMADRYVGSSVVWREENRARALPLLREAYRTAATDFARQAYAKMLGFFGDATGVETLVRVVNNSNGASPRESIVSLTPNLGLGTSRRNQLQGFVRALGATKDPRAVEPLRAYLARTVSADASLDTVRTATLALTALGHPDVAVTLAEKLSLDGLHGFAVADWRVLPPTGGYGLGPEMNDCLKELALARALVACGDRGGLGADTLAAYAADPRSVLSTYAKMMQATFDLGAAVTNFSGGTLVVPRVAGVLDVFGDADSPVTVEALAQNATLRLHGSAHVTVLAAEKGAEIQVADGMAHALSGPLSGEAVELTVRTRETGGELTLGGRLALGDVGRQFATIRLTPGAEVRMAVDPSVTVAGSGRIVSEIRWKSKVALWADASVTNTYAYMRDMADYEDAVALTNAATIQAKFYKKVSTTYWPLVWKWRDCRPGQTRYEWRNVRFTKAVDLVQQTSGENIPPYGCVEKGSLNGLSRMMTDGSRHLHLVNAETGKKSALTCAAAILVYNVQNGGGGAILGTEKGELARKAYARGTNGNGNGSLGMMTNRLVSVWADGSSVDDPTTATFDVGAKWQLLSLDFAGGPLDVSGLGFANLGSDSMPGGRGNNGYAEVLLFSEAPADDERRVVEEYLAEKWNLPCAHAGSGLADEFTLDPGTMPERGAVLDFTADESPKSLTVNLSFAGRPRGGRYALVAGDCVRTCRLGTISLCGRPWNENVTLEYEPGTKTWHARVPPQGEMIFLR